MAKSDGQYIGIQFTQELIGDVSGRGQPTIYEETAWNRTSWTSYSAGADRTAGWSFTPIHNIIVNSISYYATATHTTKAHLWNSGGTKLAETELNCNADEWASAMLEQPIELYAGMTYIISVNHFTAYGYYAYNSMPDSSELSPFISFGNDVRINSIDSFPTTYSGYKMAISFDFTVTIENEGNERAFTVSGQEYDYEPGGTLHSQTYTVDKVDAYEGDTHSLQLKINVFDRFHRVNGDITVAYDSTVGTLAGYGGPAASFTESFTPTGLVNNPHPNNPENIDITAISATAQFNPIIYTNSYNGGENVEVAALAAAGTLIHIDDI